MKVLYIYAEKFAFKIGDLSIGNSKSEMTEASFEDVQTAFIHVESSDQESGNLNKLITKFIKQTKWISRKNHTHRIILHSFAHLSESRSDPDFAKEIFNSSQERLENAGFEVHQTPFGFFLDLELKAPGRSLARVYHSIN